MSAQNPDKVGCLTPQTSSKPTALWWGTWPLTHCKWQHFSINPLTPRVFSPKTYFVNILEISRPHMSTQKGIYNMIACLSFCLASQFCSGMCRNENFQDFKNFLPSLFLLFLSSVIDLLLGLLPFQKLLRKHPWDRQILLWSSHIFHIFQASLTQSLWSRHHWKDVFLL